MCVKPLQGTFYDLSARSTSLRFVFTLKHSRVIFRRCELQEMNANAQVLKLKNQLEDAERKQRDTQKVTT